MARISVFGLLALLVLLVLSVDSRRTDSHADHFYNHNWNVHSDTGAVDSAANSAVDTLTSRYAYGRAFGTVLSWDVRDKGSSHHLDVTFSPIVDLQTRSIYNKFMANINVRSKDGSDVLVAVLNGTQIARSAIKKALIGEAGVKSISSTEGIVYGSVVSSKDFKPMPQKDFVSLLVALLKGALPGAGGSVYIFGQIYYDSNSAGIHDVHRLYGPEFVGYGDGAFVAKDSTGNYVAVLTHFSNQPCC